MGLGSARHVWRVQGHLNSSFLHHRWVIAKDFFADECRKRRGFLRLAGFAQPPRPSIAAPQLGSAARPSRRWWRAAIWRQSAVSPASDRISVPELGSVSVLSVSNLGFLLVKSDDTEQLLSSRGFSSSDCSIPPAKSLKEVSIFK